MSERTIHLRGLVSAAHPATARSLHMDVREGMVRFLQDHDSGRAFARTRILHREGLETAAHSGGDAAEESRARG